MNLNPQDLLVGSAISFVVSGLKRIPFVKKHPKVVTAVLSTVVPAGLAAYSQAKGVDTEVLKAIAAQAATQFTAAIATHETVTHTVNEKIAG